MNIESLIGIGAAPAVVWALTQHIKFAVKALRHQDFNGESEWLLVADLIGAAWAYALYVGGMLPVASPILAVLAGLAVGALVSQAHAVMHTVGGVTTE